MLRSAVMMLLLGVLPLAAGELSIGEDSVMAVITHKSGIAKGLAHNHFIYPGAFQAKLSAGEGTPPMDLALDITLQSSDLVVDDHQVSAKWYPRLEALGLLAEPFSELKEKDRGKIRKAMLGKSQLDEANHKQIAVTLLEVAAAASQVNGVAFAYKLKASFTIVGKTTETELMANITHTDGKLVLEGVGSLMFSDFDIKPYSALFGAISNQDTFHLYLWLTTE